MDAFTCIVLPQIFVDRPPPLPAISTMTNERAMLSFCNSDSTSGRDYRAVCVLLATVTAFYIFAISAASLPLHRLLEPSLTLYIQLHRCFHFSRFSRCLATLQGCISHPALELTLFFPTNLSTNSHCNLSQEHFRELLAWHLPHDALHLQIQQRVARTSLEFKPVVSTGVSIGCASSALNSA